MNKIKTNYLGIPQLVPNNGTRNLVRKIMMHKGKCTLRSSIEDKKLKYWTHKNSCVPK